MSVDRAAPPHDQRTPHRAPCSYSSWGFLAADRTSTGDQPGVFLDPPAAGSVGKIVEDLREGLEGAVAVVQGHPHPTITEPDNIGAAVPGQIVSRGDDVALKELNRRCSRSARTAMFIFIISTARTWWILSSVSFAV